MTKAILKLEGMQEIRGEAEKGGDYVKLLVDGAHAPGSFKTPVRGELEMEGDKTHVILESASSATDGTEGTLLTMRRLSPPI